MSAREVCDHGWRKVMYRSALGHLDGAYVCHICKERHLEDELQEDWGLCSNCEESPADTHLMLFDGLIVVDGEYVEVHIICVYRCGSCAT